MGEFRIDSYRALSNAALQIILEYLDLVDSILTFADTPNLTTRPVMVTPQFKPADSATAG